MRTGIAPRAVNGRRGKDLASARGVWKARALAACCALLTACSGSSGSSTSVHVELSFDPLPAIGDSTCIVAVHDASGAPLSGARIEIEGNMNHAGMVPVLATGTETSKGVYSAPFEFTMGGDWIVLLHIELADGRVVDEVFDVPAVPVERRADTDPKRSRPVKR